MKTPDRTQLGLGDSLCGDLLVVTGGWVWAELNTDWLPMCWTKTDVGTKPIIKQNLFLRAEMMDRKAHFWAAGTGLFKMVRHCYWPVSGSYIGNWWWQLVAFFFGPPSWNTICAYAVVRQSLRENCLCKWGLDKPLIPSNGILRGTQRDTGDIKSEHGSQAAMLRGRQFLQSILYFKKCQMRKQN
jgi:hypothetical protein